MSHPRLDHETLEGMLQHKNDVVVAALGAMRKSLRMLENRAKLSDLEASMKLDLREIENLDRTGQRNPENTLAVAR